MAVRDATDIEALVTELDRELRSRGTPERAEHEKAYLKSELDHYGTTVPAIRSAVKTIVRQYPELTHDDLVALVVALWAQPVHERRMAAVELLELDVDRLGPRDLPLPERLLRESRAGRASGVTLREAMKPLSEEQRAAISLKAMGPKVH